jgi:hypothetical protein
VPTYIAAAPNPRLLQAVLKALGTFLDMALDLSELEAEARRFEERINSAVQSNPEVAKHVRALEQQVDERETRALPAGPEPQLPSGADLVEELERFLRSRQRDQRGEE